MAAHGAETVRLRLQPLNVEEHLLDYFEIMSSPKSMLWSRGAPHRNLEETRVLILNSLPTLERPWNRRWAILLKPSDRSINSDSRDSYLAFERPKMIGIIGTPREGEVAYKINPHYWGQGYMSEALMLFLRSFWESEENKAFTQLQAGADPNNTASIRVLEKAGFQKGEYKKDFYIRTVSKGGRRDDMQFFYLNRPSST